MVERMSDMPAGTLGFRIGGDVTREDYTGVLRAAMGRWVGSPGEWNVARVYGG